MVRRESELGAAGRTARLERQMEETLRRMAVANTVVSETAAVYFEGISRAQEKVRRAVAVAGPSLERFAEVYRNIEVAGPGELISRVAQEFLKHDATLQEEWRRAVEQANPFMQHVAQIQRNFAEWDSSQEKAAKLLAPHGWLLPLTIALNGGARRIIKIAETEGIEAADAELMRVLGAEECHRIVGDCAQDPAFALWRPHLAAAMGAHERGEYVLAIPVWLLVLDGVAHEHLASALARGSIFGQMSRRGRRKLLDAMSNERTWSAYMTAFVRAICAVSEARSDMARGNPVLNRHAILHGRDPDYGSRKQSVQCIVMLGALAAGVGERRPPW